MNNLLAACDKATNRGKRDLALLKGFLYLGLRVGELVTLSIEDFVRDSESHRILALQGTHRTQVINIPPDVSEDLNNWLEVLDQFEGKTWDKIFVRIHKNDQMFNMNISIRQARSIVAEYGYLAGLSPKSGKYRLKPTDLRRTCGRNAYANVALLLHVQALLGHANPISSASFIDVLKKQNPNAAVSCVQYWS